MCGIFGIINIDKRPVDQMELEDGIELLQHRGPDGQGFYQEEHLGLAACRLKIMDQDDQANQPYQWKQYVLLFNGSIYNYVELRAELISEGYSFKTASDTEVIIKAYDRWDSACLHRFNGMWAIMIYDIMTKQILVSRDRFGIKPLYYYQSDTQLAFASEIKAFTKLPSWRADANVKTVSAYLAYGMQDYSEDTMFTDVRQVPAANYTCISVDQLQPLAFTQYYDLHSEYTTYESESEAIHQFRSLFYDSVKLRHRTIHELGSCLSGGLDSSSIICASKKTPASISVIYDHPKINEASYVDAVIQNTQSTNYQISPSLSGMLAALPALIWTQDEPFSSASVYAQHELYRKANDLSLRVMLEGQGADEILGGYDVFYLSILKQRLLTYPMGIISTIIEILRQYDNGMVSAWRKYRQYQSKRHNNFVAWLQSEVDLPDRKNETSISDTSRYLLQQMGLPVLLHYVDRNSMAHAVEARLPFLDHRLVELCLGLRDNLKINHGVRKWILREAMKEALPKNVYERKNKLGFETPQRMWSLENKVEINELVQQSIKQLPMVVNQKESKAINDDAVKWRLINLAQWSEVFGVQNL